MKTDKKKKGTARPSKKFLQALKLILNTSPEYSKYGYNAEHERVLMDELKKYK